MYEETLCIYYKNGICKLENERKEYQPCCTCFDKYILKEGDEVKIVEEYTLKRENGKLIQNNEEYYKEFTYIKKTEKR